MDGSDQPVVVERLEIDVVVLPSVVVIGAEDRLHEREAQVHRILRNLRRSANDVPWSWAILVVEAPFPLELNHGVTPGATC
jgi:hypothetical protein